MDMQKSVTKAVKALIAHYGGSQTATAKALGVKQPTVFAWLNSGHGVSAINAMRAEQLTGGAVKAVDLCPELKEVNHTAA